MALETLFQTANAAVLATWIALAAAPYRPAVNRVLAGVVVPLCLAAAYVVLIAAYLGESQGGFGSLAEVRALFQTPGLLLAGWLHYLAFDLFIGAWEAREAERTGLSRWSLLPALALTFLFGPAGLALFWGLRAAKLGTWRLQAELAS